MNLFKLKFRKKLKARYAKYTIYIDAATETLKFFKVDNLRIDDNCISFENSLLKHLWGVNNFMRPIDRGRIKILDHSDEKIKLVYELYYSKIAYILLSVFAIVALVTRDLDYIVILGLIILFGFILFILSQRYIFYEIINSIKLKQEE